MLIIQEIAQKIHAGSERFSIGLDAVLLLLLSVFILSGITIVPFHGDEATFIAVSQDYDVLVKQGDFQALRFDPPGDTKHRMRISIGSILPFSIGFVRDIFNIDEVNNKWDWGLAWEKNLAEGDLPDARLLTLARACSAVMGAMGMVFFFLAALRLLENRLAAWTATLLLATHGDTLMNIRRAMQEGPKFLFLLITLYLAVLVLQDLKQGKVRRFLFLLMGLASGMLLAAKQDAAPMLIAIYVALALMPMFGKHSVQSIVSNVIYLGAATLLAIASFLLLMPSFWGWWKTALFMGGLGILLLPLPAWSGIKSTRPLAMAGCIVVLGLNLVFPSQWRRLFIPISSMIDVRKALVASQTNGRIKYNESNLDTFENKAKFLLTSIWSSQVMYMEVPRFDIDPIRRQIAVYEASHIQGRIDSPILDIVVVLLFMIGLWTAFSHFNAEKLLVVVLLVVTAVLLFITIPLPWHRYFLIMQIPYSLIAGTGAGQIWIWVKQLTKPFVEDQ